MKFQIRPNVFETNSSSEHSVTVESHMLMCYKETLESWKNGKILYDAINQKLVSPEKAKEKLTEEAITEYNKLCEADEYRSPWSNLNSELRQKWIDKFIKNKVHNFDDNLWNYDEYINSHDKVETATFTTLNNEEIIAFCAYNYEDY